MESRRLLAADLISLSPLDNASGVAVDANLVLTFSENVEAGPGAGRILLKNAADDSVVEAIAIDSDRVTFNGATVTIDPVDPLPADTKLYVQIDAGGIRDTATKVAEGVLFREDFETLPLLDSKLATDGVWIDNDNYALFMNGTLDVKTAGDYTFGSNSDDGAYFAIDLNGDGQIDAFDGSDDMVIWDDLSHGARNLLTESPVALDVGQYKFEYVYFEGTGGSSGELFYGPGDLDVFDSAQFAVVGDDGQGIGVTAEGITATTYSAAVGVSVAKLQTALDLRGGAADVAQGFPVSATIPTADVWDLGGAGNYTQNNRVPGTPPLDPGEGTDYSVSPPHGWLRENSVDNTQLEYNGWTFLDKKFWIQEQGSQDRTVFTKGQNAVAVMDPDAFDDFTSISETALETFLTLPAIDLSEVSANTVKLNFDSSWRPYQDMTGLIDISFDGGTNWENLLTLDNADGDSSLARADEALSLEIANPVGGSLLIRFGMVECNNDWWWAVDNIVVTGEATGDLYEGIADRTTWNFNTFSVLPGDFNGDGEVNLTDFGLLKEHFGTGTTLAQGDANGDAKVDLTDFGILKDNFGKTGVALRATDYAFAVAVSEAAKGSTASSANDEAEDSFADDGLDAGSI